MFKKKEFKPKMSKEDWNEYFHYYGKNAAQFYEIDAVIFNQTLSFDSKIDIMFHIINPKKW